MIKFEAGDMVEFRYGTTMAGTGGMMAEQLNLKEYNILNFVSTDVDKLNIVYHGRVCKYLDGRDWLVFVKLSTPVGEMTHSIVFETGLKVPSYVVEIDAKLFEI